MFSWFSLLEPHSQLKEPVATLRPSSRANLKCIAPLSRYSAPTSGTPAASSRSSWLCQEAAGSSLRPSVTRRTSTPAWWAWISASARRWSLMLYTAAWIVWRPEGSAFLAAVTAWISLTMIAPASSKGVK